ncbi:MAG: Gfo/Idh/MocA family oxidoreductase [Pseudomonadota bacterium]|nr:Gfo/Idh/MocA family oxidoreductase [Pseudomonadota bacterium]
MVEKIALAGIGKIALDQHVPSIASSPDWELAATVSRNHAIDGVEAFRDMDAMLAARPDIGVVSLCMPPAPRFASAVAAIAAGRHVMLEKPPGATVSECLELKEMAQKAGVSLYATWHSREAPQVAAAKKWLEDKRLQRLAVTWKEDVRRWHPDQDWIWEPGGFGIFDPGINALSILTEILPDPVQVKGALLQFPANRQTPIAASLSFRHPHASKVTACFDWSGEIDQTWTIEAETDEGQMLLSEGGAVLAVDGRDLPGTAPGDNPLRGEYPRLYARMAELVRQGAIDMDLAPLTLVADAMLLGRRITVEPFYQ